jgi:hypothetical protein
MPLPPPHTPQLPSRRMSAALAALMLAAGIALGALIGPGPAASLASTSRAAAVGRVLALLALGGSTGSGSAPLLSSGAIHSQSPQPTPAATSEATEAGTGSGGAGNGSASASSGSGRSASSSPTSTPSSRSVSPTSSTTPAAGKGEGEKEKAPAVLPAIANVWLVVLPYGGSIENALKQSTAAPYLDGQLASRGTVLSNYSSLAANQLAGAATLLSGQVTASVSTIAPPPCATATAGTGTGVGAASSPTATTPGATPGPATTPGATPGQTAAAGPCPSGEPAGAQAADAFLREVVPKITASTAYTEHGLIVITFAPANQAGTTTSTATTPASGTTEAATGVAYPAGSLASTLTAEGAPAGALLLSPFLRHVGARSSSAFDTAAPRASLEGIFKTKTPGA